MPELHHELSVHTRIGILHLDADLRLTAPWTVLFGPSGSGKSSLLRAACGLLAPQGIRLVRHPASGSQRVLQDTRINTPPHLRNIRWAPQNAALFPHLTVLQNIHFSNRSAPGPGSPEQADGRQKLMDDALQLFRLASLAARYPRDLSGGERQRVNLARAFAAPDCKLLLLDEPFTGLDHALRDELLPIMRASAASRGIPVLSVTHSVEEALQLEAEVILLREGKVANQGPAQDVLAPERNRLLRTLKPTLEATS